MRAILGWAVATAVLLASTPVAAGAAAGEWPQFRGPHADGTASGLAVDGLASPDLEVVWRRPLGSGYASISVAGGRGVTLFSDGVADFVIAFDPATGEKLWRHRIGVAWKGRDGSSDGPLSTPAIAAGTVHALGARGELLTLALADGALRWSVDLVALGGEPPQYGFATSPLVVGDLLVLQAGPATVTAFDRATGEVRWTAGDDPTAYQSPVVLELHGRPQLVVSGDHHVYGLEPSTGEILWRSRHTADGQARGGSGLPVRLGDDRFLLRPGPDEIGLWRLGGGAGGLRLEEVWRSDLLLKRSHAAPLLHEGHVYSFDQAFLTCLDAATGERLWKSRPPGGRGLIRVDRYLVVLGTQGHLVLAEASPEGYRETARQKVLESGSWTPPSFAGGLFFVRDLEEMAAVRVVERAVPAEVLAAEVPGTLGRVLRYLDAATDADRRELFAELLAARQSLPWVEADGIVHFLYRGAAEDVAVSGNFTDGFGEEVPMERVPGTDVWMKSVRLDPASHYEYRFHVDFGPGRPDPGNPHAIGSGFGPSSELRMSDWPVPEFFAERPEATARGRLEQLSAGDLEVRVYLPAGFEAPAARALEPRLENRLPLLVVQESAGGATSGLESILDALIGRRVEPLVVAFLPPLRGEHSAAALEAYRVKVVGALLPELERRYGVDSERRVLLGAGSGAPIATYLAFASPGTFRGLSLQSFYLGGLFGKIGTGVFSMTPELQAEILDGVRSSRRQEMEVRLEWSVAETRDASSGLDARSDTDRLLAALTEAGYSVRTVEVPGRPGYGSWRARLGEVLEAYFPLR